MDDPMVSIVILTKNGGVLLEESIKMIFLQKTSFLYEVVIVDSGSSDGTLSFLKRYPVRIFQIMPHEFSFGPTRDFAFEQTNGKYIATISQDVMPRDDGWLQNLVDPLLKNESDIAQGHCIALNDRDIFFWERRKFFYFTKEGEKFCRTHGNIGLSCTNLAVKKAVWEDIKFGNIPMNEDKAFQKKAYLKGYRITGNKKAISYHGHTYSMTSLMKRCENEGLGWKYVDVKYSLSQMLRDLRQKKWVYGELIRSIKNGEIRHLSEILFLVIRPIFLYKGNRFNRKYKF